ncbi:cyclopropane-fatty-acyl-phospholipid synthase family protein [Arthrobacter sp. ISL-30]|uniref:SAM-dependent methyltransferase n=1 Tax=Arthrobacter sp. ISL-30 TaxID=2819109 RepID=UPI001BEB260E|nr:methyltransferase domain-containing protein [Arthrobacter sp. ISL-30]MBT2512666.1 methyltransferase domain-containing protein [Arthrobacter sp. ISL-30]
MEHNHGGRTSAEVWDEMYRSRPKAWSGRPNPQLVAEAADLPAGTALDLGCGEGADAVWLAERGWSVTAVDVSAVALHRAAAHAAEAGGDELADRIKFVRGDLATWAPHRGFDLVSAQYLHSTVLPWQEALGSAADAVVPGGTLLIVGHHPDALPPGGNHVTEDMFYRPDDLVRELGIEGPDWEVQVLERRDRTVTGPEGGEVTIGDSVLKARRRA